MAENQGFEQNAETIDQAQQTEADYQYGDLILGFS